MMDEAVKHCALGWESGNGRPIIRPQAGRGDGVLRRRANAGNARGSGSVERTLADVKVRVVNVVNLMKLQPPKEHPHGLTDDEFDAIFTTDRQIIFAFHGYPSLIHQLTYRRTNHGNLHVRGYKEEGTTTTPFDMVVMNDVDRFHLVMDVIDRVPGLADRVSDVRRAMVDKRAEHKRYIAVHGEDMPEITDWRWRGGTAVS